MIYIKLCITMAVIKLNPRKTYLNRSNTWLRGKSQRKGEAERDEQRGVEIESVERENERREGLEEGWDRRGSKRGNIEIELSIERIEMK